MSSEKDTDLLIKILSDTATDTEKEEFEAWLNESELNRKYYQKARILWKLTEEGSNKSEIDKETARKKILNKIRNKQVAARKLRIRYLVSAAVSIVILIGLTVSVSHFITRDQRNYIAYTSGDHIRRVVLSDSSHIWLNEHSTIRVPAAFNENQRKVFLEGEAYFEVTHNEKKPFTTIAGKTVVKDLGTTFDVKTNKKDQDVSVVVRSGSVVFYKRYSLFGKNVLRAHQKAQYIANDHKITITTNRNQNYLSWKTGILTFYDTPLKEVCKELSEHYNTTVRSEINDPAMTLTGKFQHESLDETLKTIELTLNVKIKISQKEIILYK